MGKGFFFVPGQRDGGRRNFFLSWEKGTAGRSSRIVPGRPVPSRPVETLVKVSENLGATAVESVAPCQASLGGLKTSYMDSPFLVRKGRIH